MTEEILQKYFDVFLEIFAPLHLMQTFQNKNFKNKTDMTTFDDFFIFLRDSVQKWRFWCHRGR